VSHSFCWCRPAQRTQYLTSRPRPSLLLRWESDNPDLVPLGYLPEPTPQPDRQANRDHGIMMGVYLLLSLRPTNRDMSFSTGVDRPEPWQHMSGQKRTSPASHSRPSGGVPRASRGAESRNHRLLSGFLRTPSCLCFPIIPDATSCSPFSGRIAGLWFTGWFRRLDFLPCCVIRCSPWRGKTTGKACLEGHATRGWRLAWPYERGEIPPVLCTDFFKPGARRDGVPDLTFSLARHCWLLLRLA